MPKLKARIDPLLPDGYKLFEPAIYGTSAELVITVPSLAVGYKLFEPASFRTSAELTTLIRTNSHSNGEVFVTIFEEEISVGFVSQYYDGISNTWEFQIGDITRKIIEKRIDGDFHDRRFYTSNLIVYDLDENGEAVLYFGGREANPILGNIDEACQELNRNLSYRLSPNEKQAVLNSVEAGLTLKVRLTELELRTDNSTHYFKIDPTKAVFTRPDYARIEENERLNRAYYDSLSDSQRMVMRQKYGPYKRLSDRELADLGRGCYFSREDYDGLNPSQRALAEMVYDKGIDFTKNMRMFKEYGIPFLQISVLDPDGVKKEAKEGPIAKCGRIIFSLDKICFDANNAFTNSPFTSLMGVKK